jgi:arsenite methyltransferase
MATVAGAVSERDWSDEIKERIRRRYQRLAEERDFLPAGAHRMLESGYPRAVLQRLPGELTAAYSGCGFPAAGSGLRDVRLAVDLGCGAGIDASWMASEMAAGGAIVALDMTRAMLQVLSRSCGARVAAAGSIWPLVADLERLPLASGIADLVVANASFNLAVDKHSAFKEAFRILKPAGRLVARDLVREGELPREVLEDPLADVTSLGGAVSEEALRRVISEAGFTDVRISDHRRFSFLTSVRVEGVRPA